MAKKIGISHMYSLKEKQAKPQTKGIRNRLIELIPILQKVAVGDFENAKIEVPEKEDEFTEFYVGLMLMIEDLRELDRERKSAEGARDSEIKKTEDEKNRFRAFLESIGDGVMVIDKNGVIALWNSAAFLISGWQKEEAIGKYFRDVLKLIHEKDRNPNSAFIEEAMKTGKTASMANNTLLIRKDGTEIAIGDSAAPIFEETGNISGVIVVFRDMTKERQLDRAKEEFVSIASHQLRTPLTAIKGYSGMLLDGDAGALNEKQRDYIQEIKHGNDRMIELITALLNVSKIDLGVFAVEPRPINFEDIAKSVLKDLAIIIEDKKLKVESIFEENLPLINADPKLIRMIFQNLFSNAVKYTLPEKSIILKIKKQDHDILLTVADNGYGIPKYAQSKIFTKMFRADNAREKDPDGTGLGLYIIKAIIEESGGKIWFESEENKGTIFYVSIPLGGMKKKEGNKNLL